MSDELFCTRIQAIESLIPASLKNKYVEYYELIDANTTLLFDYAKYFDKNKLVEKKVFEKYLVSRQTVSKYIKGLLEENIIEKREKNIAISAVCGFL